MMKTTLLATISLLLLAVLAPTAGAAPTYCYGIQQRDACTGHGYYDNSAGCLGKAENETDCTGYWYDDEEPYSPEPTDAPTPESCTVMLWEGGTFLYNPLTGEPMWIRSETWLCLG